MVAPMAVGSLEMFLVIGLVDLPCSESSAYTILSIVRRDDGGSDGSCPELDEVPDASSRIAAPVSRRD